MIFYLFLDELTLHIDSTQRELKKVTAAKQVCTKCLHQSIVSIFIYTIYSMIYLPVLIGSYGR